MKGIISRLLSRGGEDVDRVARAERYPRKEILSDLSRVHPRVSRSNASLGVSCILFRMI